VNFNFSRLFKTRVLPYCEPAMTIERAYQPFLLYGQVERRYSSQTLEKFRECFQSWIRPHLGSAHVEDVAYLDLLAFRKAMDDAGLSVARQYSILMVLKLFFRFCRMQLKLSCLDPNEIRLPRRQMKRVEFLTEAEIALLLRVIPTHNFTGLRLRALVEVLLTTGLRISEALSLNRDSIDLQNGEAEIIGKGGRPRTVFFSNECLGWIDRFVALRCNSCPALFTTTGKDPRRLRRGDMSKAFKRLKRLSGITKRLSPHLLRHTFCTSLLHNGADIMFIKELAGHRDIQTTARYYLGVDKAALKAVLNRSRIHGWRQQDEDRSVLPIPPDSHRRDTFRAPAWPLANPDPSNTGTSSLAAHGPESL
jgi:integrase/recombinase XerD